MIYVKEIAKRSYFQYLFQRAKNPTDTWKHINVLLRKTKPKSTIPRKVVVGNEIIASPQTICDKMNNHFVKIGKKLSASLQNKLHSKDYMKYLGKRNSFLIILRPTDKYEIIEIAGKLNNNKSTVNIGAPVVLIARYFAGVFKVIPLHRGGSK